MRFAILLCLLLTLPAIAPAQELPVPAVQIPAEVGEIVLQFRSARAKDGTRENTFAAVFEVCDKAGKRLPGESGQQQLSDAQVRLMLGDDAKTLATIFAAQVVKLNTFVASLRKAMIAAAKAEDEATPKNR